MSSLTLERLLFDRADVAGSPQLGAHLLGDSSAVITSHTVASDEGLDVYLLNTSIVVSATDLDIRDLTSATDSVEIKTAAGQALAIDGSGYITANINGSVTVSATDLDIRDLVYTSDSVTAHQGGTWSNQITDGVDTLAINADGSINVNLTDDSIADDEADAGNPLKVGSKAYNQASVWGTVDANDRANLASDLYRRVLINDAPNVSLASAAVSVDDTAGGTVIGTSIAGRLRFLIQNNGNHSLFVGATGVTAATGLEIAKGATLALELGEAVDLYGIAPAGKTIDVRVLQLA